MVLKLKKEKCDLKKEQPQKYFPRRNQEIGQEG